MAQLIDKNSVPTTNSLLDFFTVPPTQTAIDSSYWHVAHPVHTIRSEGPFQFVLPGGPDYAHLARNYLYMKVKIVKPDGTAMAATAADAAAAAHEAVGPINLFGKTFVKQVKLNLNGKLAYDSGDMYAYRAYLETELNYGTDAKNTVLTPSLYEKDTPADKVESAENTGFVKRATKFKNSTVVEIMAPIHCDLFAANKLLISNTHAHLEIYRNTDAFLLMCFGTATAYKVEILDMLWYVKMLQLPGSVHLGVETALMRNPAKYPIRRVAITKVHISPGRKNTPTTSVFDGQLPRRIVIGFVDTNKYFGSYKTNPFMFENHNVTEISVHAGGNVYPREHLKMDYKLKHFARPYLQLMEALGFSDDNVGNAITPEDFSNYLCLYAFDLSPEQTDGPHWELVRDGTVTVHCQFADAIKDPGLEMICYAEFDNLLMVDRNRSVYFDYSV